MSVYGYEKDTTPQLSELADTLFEPAYSNAPYTAASLPSLLSGQLPLSDGHIATRSLPTLATVLSDTEYTTYIGHSNLQIPRFGLDSDFDYVDEHASWKEDEDEDSNKAGLKARLTQSIIEAFRSALRKDDIRKPTATALRALGESFVGIHSSLPEDKKIFENAREWISEDREPYFMWLHLMDTHSPYAFQSSDFENLMSENYSEGRHARLLNFARTHSNSGDFVWSLSKDQREYLVGTYDAAIRNFDRRVSRFIDSLNLSKSTVIVSSDHGEELWDHGHYGHGGNKNSPRTVNLYEEVIKVPLILLGENAPDAAKVNVPVSLIDVFSTVIDHVDIEDGADANPGDSLYKIAKQPDQYSSRNIFSQATDPIDPNAYMTESGRLIGSTRHEKWKYISDIAMNGESELYNLHEDPTEQVNIADEHPERCESFERQIKQQFAEDDTEIPELNNEAKAKLQDLGYL